MLPGMALVVAAAGSLSLTYKGHGLVNRVNNPGATTMNYATVSNGSAPVAGDLVVWHWMIGLESYDTSPVTDGRRQDLTGSGWVQDNKPEIMGAVDGSALLVSTILAKQVTAGDISSPPTIQPESDFAVNYGKWTAYTVAGTISSLTIPVHTRNDGGASAPANVAVDSSAINPPEVAITSVFSSGTDGAIQLSGITLDHELSQANLGDYFTANTDIRIGEKFDVGGASYTLSKGDDGNQNVLAGGYVKAT